MRTDEAAIRLTTIPGIGVLGATALVAAIGDGEAFHRARDIPAWLGLVPKQTTTGGKPRLLGITKRGNNYLRMLLIHGARAALPSLLNRSHHNRFIDHRICSRKFVCPRWSPFGSTSKKRSDAPGVTDVVLPSACAAEAEWSGHRVESWPLNVPLVKGTP